MEKERKLNYKCVLMWFEEDDGTEGIVVQKDQENIGVVVPTGPDQARSYGCITESNRHSDKEEDQVFYNDFKLAVDYIINSAS